jgi:hypothetical protein
MRASAQAGAIGPRRSEPPRAARASAGVTALALLLVLASGQPAARWEVVSASPEGRLLIDRATLRRAGDEVAFRISYVHASPAPGAIAEELMDLRIDCRRSEMIITASLMRRALERVSDKLWLEEATELRAIEMAAKPIAPGSEQEALMERACARGREER